MIHHWGRTTVTGQADIALAQMMHVNGWSIEQAEKAGDEGFLVATGILIILG